MVEKFADARKASFLAAGQLWNPTQRRLYCRGVPLAEYLSPTPQQSSNLQALVKSGKIAIGTSLSYPSRHVAKTIAVTGADFCWIDAEHVAWSQKLLVECIQIIIHESGGKMIPVVRVPSKTAFDYMAWCLDAGAGGIIIAHVETVEEMKEGIAACRFPPIDHRSFPPFSYVPNKHVAIMPQIESRLGIQNLDAIMEMDEISAFMIGVGDLRLDMGAALGPELVKQRIDEEFKILVCCFDLHLFSFGMIKTLGEARAAAKEHIPVLAAAGILTATSWEKMWPKEQQSWSAMNDVKADSSDERRLRAAFETGEGRACLKGGTLLIGAPGLIPPLMRRLCPFSLPSYLHRRPSRTPYTDRRASTRPMVTNNLPADLELNARLFRVY
ncbi:Pyruvate/Phosphoenolpyruvate kinase-like domain-containing protein [Mycena vulgaris]|nr:Pyruvate/Phosphoenolpyruvate kinase-like domain-containing protein [Mycena vulgaris]